MPDSTHHIVLRIIRTTCDQMTKQNPEENYFHEQIYTYFTHESESDKQIFLDTIIDKDEEFKLLLICNKLENSLLKEFKKMKEFGIDIN